MSRADLILLMDADGEITGPVAGLCGFVALEEKSRSGTESVEEGVSHEEGEENQELSPVTTLSEATKELPPWVFTRATEFEAIEPMALPGEIDSDPVLGNDELRVRYDRPPLDAKPLVPWPRLVPFLRRALGRQRETSRVHDRRLGRMLARGLPLIDLPRRRRRFWALQAVILRDRWWREMAPFRDDVEHLIRRLQNELGKSGLKVIPVDGPPPPRAFARVSPGTPILALSTLGQYEGDFGTLKDWIGLARWLAARGHSFEALCPCPRRFWREPVCAAWPMAVWDGKLRPPRRPGWRHVIPHHVENNDALESLLDLLAPAAFVERPLLRAVRLQMAQAADVGTEWEGWFHDLGWPSSDTFGLVDPAKGASADEQSIRLKRRGDHALADEVDAMIVRQHQRHSPLIELESRMRSGLRPDGCEPVPMELTDLLCRVVQRLRTMDPEAGDHEDRQSNLAPWFVSMVERIPPELRSHQTLSRLIAEGLGLAHRFLQTQRINWPTGVDVAGAIQGLESGTQPRLSKQVLRLAFRPGSLGEDTGKKLALLSLPEAIKTHETPVGSLLVNGPYLHLEKRGGAKNDSQTLFLEGAEHFLGWLEDRECQSFILNADAEKLACERFHLPTWASRVWYDRFGLAVEFRVNKVPFVMRWIPPGRFLMGSPEGEEGRASWEGPRHERVIAKGFWLGETPVTQGQWRAVAGENPSHFQGPGSLPVESVSWEECHRWCEELRGVVPGPGFRLPREEEWEYACRAGTDTALWPGPFTIPEDYYSPELEDLAWYVGNSWQELEVDNPYDTKDLVIRHPKGKLAGTHRVKLKRANPWGLHDMLGNVFEWCSDVWDEEAYVKREGGAPPEEGDESALRVVRGGSWDVRARDCRAAYRDWVEPDVRGDGLGFRLAAGQEQEAAEPSGAERPGRRGGAGPGGPEAED